MRRCVADKDTARNPASDTSDNETPEWSTAVRSAKMISGLCDRRRGPDRFRGLGILPLLVVCNAANWKTNSKADNVAGLQLCH